MRHPQHPGAVEEQDHRQAVHREFAAGALRGGHQHREAHVLRTRELLGARGVVVEIHAEHHETRGAVGARDAVERLELRAAGVARAAPEANYHDVAAELGDAHVLAREPARDQVRRGLPEQLVRLGGARVQHRDGERAAECERSKSRVHRGLGSH